MCARCSSGQKQGARIEAIRRPGYRYTNHRDRDASGGNHVHFLQESKVEGRPRAFHVLRSTRRLEGKINFPLIFIQYLPRLFTTCLQNVIVMCDVTSTRVFKKSLNITGIILFDILVQNGKLSVHTPLPNFDEI